MNEIITQTDVETARTEWLTCRENVSDAIRALSDLSRLEREAKSHLEDMKANIGKPFVF